MYIWVCAVVIYVSMYLECHRLNNNIIINNNCNNNNKSIWIYPCIALTGTTAKEAGIYENSKGNRRA